MDAFFRHYFPDDIDSQRAYHRELQAWLPRQGALLDLGCGDLRELARYRTADRQVWGTDFERHPRLREDEWFRTLPADGRLPFADATFDLVATTWVLEHVAKPVAFCREVARVLRPGGKLVGLTANGAHYVTLISRLVGCLPHEVTQQIVYRLYGRLPQDTHPTHYRINTPGQLRRSARCAGLKVGQIAQFANPDYFSFSAPLRRLAIVTDWLLERMLPGLGRLYLVATLEKPAAAPGRIMRQAA